MAESPLLQLKADLPPGGRPPWQLGPERPLPRALGEGEETALGLGFPILNTPHWSTERLRGDCP